MQQKRKGTAKDSILLSVRDTAELFGVSQNYLYRNAERLPHYKFSNRIRFSAEELLKHWKVSPHSEER